MYNLSASDGFAIAQIELEQYMEAQAETSAPIKIPQRRAQYHDKNRVRLKDVKGWVFHCTGARSTKEISAALKKLGKKLDLRLTAAWLEIDLNWTDAIANIIRRDRLSKFVVGSRVAPIEYTARTAYAQVWSPHTIVDIVDEEAVLDMLAFRVPLSNLRLVA